MERLTRKKEDGTILIERHTEVQDCLSNYMLPSDIAAVHRLAAYEDTGLEPHEIRELQAPVEERIEAGTLAWFEKHYGIGAGRMMELAQADKEGRIALLPHKKGHTWEKCGGCEHFSREPGKKCGTCEAGRYEGVVLYQSHKACSADFVPGSNTAPKGDVYESNL